MAAGGWPTLQAELDSMTDDALLRHLEAGIEEENWDRRQQLVGSTLSYRAVQAAARSKTIQTSAKANGGASRSEIMGWIEKSEKFGKWRALMLTKLEIKSYQASITKALIRAEFERTGTSGRYIKWLLPKSLLKETQDKQEEEEVEESDKEEVEESGDEEESEKQENASQTKQESEASDDGEDNDDKDNDDDKDEHSQDEPAENDGDEDGGGGDDDDDDDDDDDGADQDDAEEP
jgi:hypothetical protein